MGGSQTGMGGLFGSGGFGDSGAGGTTPDIQDLGADIQAGMGTTFDQVKASEVVLISELLDDSGSIRFGGNAQIVRDGHNLIVDSLKKTKQKNGILMTCRMLNSGLLFPFTLIENATLLDQHNYNPGGGTPLYDESVLLLDTAFAKWEQSEADGIPGRTINIIVTDGNDEGSRQYRAPDVSERVRKMLKKSERHIVTAMGIDDGQTDFRVIFKAVGIPDEWILTPKNTESEIRKCFAMLSQSAVRASQNATSFSKVALGGLGTTP